MESGHLPSSDDAEIWRAYRDGLISADELVALTVAEFFRWHPEFGEIPEFLSALDASR